MGVSGCARECAEARGKDVGVIATENGWNLYVGGNGGFQPAHAQLLAGDLDDDTLIRYIDRYLMYYVRTADRLQRTARWQEDLDGGLDHVREVVCEDSLGIAAELEAAMAAHVGDYHDEWAATLADPERLQAVPVVRQRAGDPRSRYGEGSRARPGAAAVDGGTRVGLRLARRTVDSGERRLTCRSGSNCTAVGSSWPGAPARRDSSSPTPRRRAHASRPCRRRS